jgi:hypothetical protein
LSGLVVAAGPGPGRGRVHAARSWAWRTAWRQDAIGPRSAWSLFTAASIVVLTWPFVSRSPLTLDRSWQLGLHQAVADGLRFGHDIVFSYGPLGFLNNPTPFVGATSALAFLAAFVLHLAVALTVLIAANRLFAMWVAVLLALVLARTVESVPRFEILQLVVFMLGVEMLRRPRVSGPGRLAALLALLAAIAVLGKVNVGVIAAAMGATIVLGVSPHRVRGLLIYGATFLVSCLALWVATGNQLSDLAPYARGSIDIAAGYSDAMARDQPQHRWVILAFVPVCLMVAWAAYRTSSDWSRWRRLALGGVTIILLFAIWKHGFVRDHFGVTFATLTLVLVVLLPRDLPRSTSITMVLAVLMVFFGASLTPAARFVSPPVSSVMDFARQAATALLPWRWDDATAATRQYLARESGVPPDILAAVEGRKTHIDPYQAAVATAYPGVVWRPVPVFQSYSAYTPYLDELNAQVLRSPDRPERILRQFTLLRVDGERNIPFSVDERFYWFESPAATIERLCRYEEIAADGDWQVLAPSGRDCGDWLPLGSVTTTFREPVAVPSAPGPDQLVVVRVHGAGDGLARRVRSAAWRGAEWYVELDGFRYRFVPATGGDGLVLAVPASAQGSTPFAFGPPITTIAIGEIGSGRRGELAYEFFAVPMSPP